MNYKRTFKLKELEIRIDSYKYYLNIALQANAFFYVITGAVLGFYLTGLKDQPTNIHLKYFFLLPILIGSVLGAIFIYGSRMQWLGANSIERIRREFGRMGINIEEIPDLNFLHLLLQIFGTIFIAVGVSLIIVPLIGAGSFGRDKLAYVFVASTVLVGGVTLTYSFARRRDKNLTRRRSSIELERNCNLR